MRSSGSRQGDLHNSRVATLIRWRAMPVTPPTAAQLPDCPSVPPACRWPLFVAAVAGATRGS